MSLLRTLLLTSLSVAAIPAFAQDRPSSILVLDGSGSMWGQIDGKAKITIAQEVVGDLLTTLPGTTDLGLTVYGHRQKGNCADIETVVQPGPDTRDAIAQAVNAIKPKGKTPLTDAVRVAAEALRYTEEKATVILVSDGRETCVADPCAVAKTLEETGVDLTVHVVGFDVSDDDLARGQLQCLADETGGQFVMADNAAQLSDALTSIAETPEPTPVETRFVALDGEGGAEMNDDAAWQIAGPDGFSADGIGRFALSLMPGDYSATVIRLSDETQASGDFKVAQDDQTVTLIVPVVIPTATVTGPATAIVGQTIDVSWEGPGDEGDFVSVHAVGGNEWPINSTNISAGNPLSLRMPSTPGQYELRYQTKRERQVIARTEIKVLPAEVTLVTSENPSIGSAIEITWTGPANRGDFISVADVGGDVWPINYTDINNGNPLELHMPATPGSYELRYQLAEEREIIHRQPINVVDAVVSLSFQAEAQVGETINIEWSGPANTGDFISVHTAEGDVWAINDVNTAQGSPLQLRMPHKPGDYEIRYQLSEEREIIRRDPITITAAQVSLTAPAQAEIGQTIDVTWDGPGNRGDFISVNEAGGNEWPINDANVNDGSPLKLRMPHKPGAYEIRYQLAEERAVIHRVPITIEPVSVTITAPSDAKAGQQAEVTWTGPANRGDVISIHEVGGDTWAIKTKDIASGSPLMLQMPDQPGDYELRYQLAEERAVIHRVPITVSE
ncbi:MAG: VWA domain-containing protein [Pelagimonas sp.]|uniref:VWA domain-containing protein n=1 Tax=Pelagimonas sp. TaxID=2073170 RepID=UPI003D6B5643